MFSIIISDHLQTRVSDNEKQVHNWTWKAEVHVCECIKGNRLALMREMESACLVRVWVHKASMTPERRVKSCEMQPLCKEA